MLAPLTSPLLHTSKIKHGFFTCQGGVSTGVYSSLNCGMGSADNVESIAKNRQRVQQYFEAQSLHSQYQTHSSDVVHVTRHTQTAQEADAIVTSLTECAIGVLTADCGPLLLADTQHGIIGCAHAGWKGATSSVIEHTIQSMESIGAKRSNIKAALGPCISQESYQVDQKFYERLIEKKSSYHSCFVPCPTHPRSHFRFNLKACIGQELKRLGIQHIDILPQDTYTDGFFSFRRSTHTKEADYGRQMSAIMLI